MWQRFTERARKAIFFAQEEAGNIGENYVSTEHVLLGLLREPDSVAGRIIQRMGMDPVAIRASVEQRVARGNKQSGQDMQLTPRAKRVIDLSYEEAKLLNNNYIGTEHLLLGLMRESEGLAGRVLEEHGANLNVARQAVRQLQAGGIDTPIAVPQPQLKPSQVNSETSVNRLIANAIFEARELGCEQPQSDHFLLALFAADDGRSVKLLSQLGITREMVLEAIQSLG